MLKDEYQKIKDNKDLSIKEKLEAYEKLRDKIENKNEEYYDLFSTITVEGYKYCDKCKDYYRENTFEHDLDEELESECTNPLTGGYLDAYEYRDVYRKYEYAICPKGHYIKGRCIGFRYPNAN